MKIVNLILFTFLGLFIFACGGTDTSLEFETVAYVYNDDTGTFTKESGKSEVPADGKSYVEIRAKVTSADGEVYDGREVSFTTTRGLFKTDETSGGETEVDIKTRASVASIRLYATVDQGEANVEATFDDTMYEGTSVTKSIVIIFGNLTVGSKLSACHFEITCDAKNLGAYVDTNIATECFIKTENRKQLPVSVPDIEFKLETGKMLTIKGETPASNRYFYVADPIKRPKDVEPLMSSGEFGNDCTRCSDHDPQSPVIERCKCGLTTPIMNPRDSLVTIIAYANGEECFEDLNSNEIFDNNEKIYGNFVGEPFVDSNDNAKRDSDEQYVESFGDPNEYSDEEGIWDDNIMVWTQTKILLTGVPDEFGEENTRLETNSGEYIDWENEDLPDIHCNASNNFYFYLYDEYLNPIATNENDSSMTINMDGSDISGIYDKENAELNFNIDKYGFEMDAKGRILKFNDKDDDNGARYTVIAMHAPEDCAEYETTNKAYRIRIEINTSPGISNDHYPVEGEEKTIVHKVWEYTGKIIK